MTSIKKTRRQFLAASAATAASAFMPGVLKTALAAAPAGNSLSAVKHVVIFMQENRSFDHYFGTLQGVRGFNDRAALRLFSANSVLQQSYASGTEGPFHLDTSSTNSQCVTDLDHSWTGSHTAWNNGKNDSWIIAKTIMTMGYYNRNDIPFHYALADSFTVCDNYFCSMMGPTNPNRLYLWSGMVDPNGTAGGPVTSDSETGYSWTTYPERLQAAGVSWKVYQNASDNFDDNALAWFKQYQNAAPGTPLHDRGMASVQSVTGNTVKDIAAAIQADVLNGTLPQVSWVVAPASASEHPNNAPAAGADMVSQVLAALTSNPSVWASTVLFLNFDEHGGFFDHVIPPVPPSGTADEFINGAPIGLGPRVPMTVVSPWSRGGRVNSQVFDHTSVLRFLETWTGVQEPNISAWRRQVCGDLTSTLNFSSTTVTVPNLPDTATLAAQAASQCANLPSPSAPGTATSPTQEAGQRVACALPYQPNGNASLDKTNGIVWITMNNTGTQAVHHSIYANAYRVDGPWQYDVPANGTVKDYFHAQTYGLGWYDLSLYGPNGFLRRFTGNMNYAGSNVEVTASYSFATAGHAQLLLTMVNSSTAAVTFTVTSNAYRTDGPWTYTVPAGGTVSDFWNVQLYTNGWYDFTATVNIDSSFSRRFLGHIEMNAASLTG